MHLNPKCFIDISCMYTALDGRKDGDWCVVGAEGSDDGLLNGHIIPILMVIYEFLTVHFTVVRKEFGTPTDI